MNLQPGDEVSIIGPASQLRAADKHLLPMAVSLLESWGLHVQVRVDGRNHFYLAGPDLARAEHLNAAIADPRCRAIFCLRGGYGSPRLLSYLDSSIRPGPKMLVGFSDLTALHAAVDLLWPQIDLIYGPNVATKQFLGQTQACEVTRQSLHDVLFMPEDSLFERIDFIRPGRAKGALIGGCLSMLVTLLGTRYAPETTDKILFLEDVGESPYRIDRMLTHLRNASKLEHVRGIVFGEMRDCCDPHNDLRDVLRDLFCDDDLPVAFGLRSGHGEVNLSLRLGGLAELDSDESTFRLA
jgi:muramoyltetrapeptide carboxypeptidase